MTFTLADAEKRTRKMIAAINPDPDIQRVLEFYEDADGFALRIAVMDPADKVKLELSINESDLDDKDTALWLKVVIGQLADVPKEEWGNCKTVSLWDTFSEAERAEWRADVDKVRAEHGRPPWDWQNNCEMSTTK